MTSGERAADLERVRASYDVIADAYADQFIGELRHKPIDRTLLTSVAEQAAAGGIVADIGCGPGHIAGYLQELGVHAVGVDLSARMIALARRRFTGPRFLVASMLSLPFEDGVCAGLVALYSVIHLDPDDLPRAWAEFRRVMRPHASLLIAFHVGEEVRNIDELFARSVDLDFHFLQVDAVVEQLDTAGFVIDMRMVRAPYTAVEGDTQRGYVLARRRG